MEAGVLIAGGVLALGALVATLVGVIVAVVHRARRAATQRRDEFARVAAAHGWAYLESDDALGSRFPGRPFELGHSRRTTNIVSGRHGGRHFVAFDFTHHTTERSTDGEGRATTRQVAHPHSVVVAHTGARLPELEVAPIGFVGRLVGRFAHHALELGDAEFDRSFTVTCPDPRFAREVLQPGLRHRLLGMRGATVRFTGDSVMALHPRHHSVPELLQRLDALLRIVDDVPGSVWHEYGPGGAQHRG